MAAIRKLSKNVMLSSRQSIPISGTLSASSVIPAILLSCRGLASKLFVSGLPFSTTEQELAEEFSRHGQVIEVEIPINRTCKRPRGFGFVTFASLEEAEKAVDEMNGKPLNGRVIAVNYARPGSRGRDAMPIARGPPEGLNQLPAPEIENSTTGVC